MLENQNLCIACKTNGLGTTNENATQMLQFLVKVPHIFYSTKNVAKSVADIKCNNTLQDRIKLELNIKETT